MATPSKKELKQLRKWRNGMLHAYRVGNLTETQIESLETIPGWYWRHGSRTIERRKIRFLQIRARYKNYTDPGYNSKNKQEKSDSTWLSNMRQIKQRASDNVRYEIWDSSIEELATEHGWEGVFETTRKTDEKDKTKHLLELIQKYKTLDGFLEKATVVERSWCTNTRRVLSGKARGTPCNELLIIAAKHGWLDIFQNDMSVIKCLVRLNKIFGRYDSPKDLFLVPIASRTDHHNDRAWVISMTKSRYETHNAGARSGQWNDRYLKHAIEHGWPTMFDKIKKPPDQTIKTFLAMIKKYKTPNNLPASNDMNGNQITTQGDRSWLCQLANKMRNRTNTATQIARTSAVMDLATEHGWTSIFVKQGHRKISSLSESIRNEVLITFICPVCEKPKQLRPHENSSQTPAKDRKFCSFKCFHKRWQIPGYAESISGRRSRGVHRRATTKAFVNIDE